MPKIGTGETVLEKNYRAANETITTLQREVESLRRINATLTEQINDRGHKTYNALLEEVKGKDERINSLVQESHDLKVKYDEVYKVLGRLRPLF